MEKQVRCPRAERGRGLGRLVRTDGFMGTVTRGVARFCRRLPWLAQFLFGLYVLCGLRVLCGRRCPRSVRRWVLRFAERVRRGLSCGTLLFCVARQGCPVQTEQGINPRRRGVGRNLLSPSGGAGISGGRMSQPTDGAA